MPPPLRHGIITVNGLALHYAECGDGPLVLFLHGFPEFWHSWRQQLEALAQAGFRAVALDQRGYNLSQKPARVEDYRIEHLCADVEGLIEGLGHSQAVVVGHDWGGVVAWATAMRHPRRVARLAVLNAPHPAAYLRELKRGIQLLRSWYILFFQLPWVPERLLASFNLALLRRIWRKGPAGLGDEGQVERYVQAFSQPGAIRGAVHYYRALFRRGPGWIRDQNEIIECPTLLLWGQKDPYLGSALSRGLDPWIPNLTVRRFPQCGHWLQNEAPDEVNRCLIEFCQGWRDAQELPLK